MNIAVLQGMHKEETLSHDLFDCSILFDFSSTTSDTTKWLIVAEIEKVYC